MSCFQTGWVVRDLCRMSRLSLKQTPNFEGQKTYYMHGKKYKNGGLHVWS